MSANSGWPTMTTGQSNKESTFNTGLGKLDAFVSESMDIDVTSGTTSYTLSDANTQGFFHFQLTPNGGSPPTAGQLKTLALGAIRKFILIENRTLADFTASRSGGTTVFIPSNSRMLVYLDGTTVVSMAVSGSTLNGVGGIYRVRAAVDSNVTISTALNNGDVAGGVTLATGDDVLLFAQSTASQNGIYEVAASPARSPFAANTGQIVPGMLVIVSEGTYAGMIFYCTNTSTPIIATDSVTFAKIVTKVPVVVPIHAGGTPAVNSLVWRMVITDVSMSIPDEFLGAVGRVATNPSSTTDFDVKRNNSSIGTISISTGGVFTFTTSGGADIALAVNDYIDIVAPSNLNGLADLSVTFKWYR